MLERITIDNYKCFSNFELAPGALTLLLGRNGCGKTGLFEVLRALRELVAGRCDVATVFAPETRTRWDRRGEQHFTLEVRGPTGLYRYALQVEHRERERGPQCRIAREELALDGRPLFAFTGGEVHLYRDDHSAGPIFPADWSRSALGTVPERHDNTKLSWFKNWLRGLWVLGIDPRAMDSESSAEAPEPARDLSNFASWYRHVSLERPADLGALFEHLAEAVPGFASLQLQQTGERGRHLTASFDVGADEPGASGGRAVFGLEELSDGQRCLMALYSLLHFGLRRGGLLCLDEPDNFVALCEIQPWLVALRERVEDQGAQVLLISHGREVINYLAQDAGVLFERQAGGPVRVRPFEGDTALLPAETMARGWE